MDEILKIGILGYGFMGKTHFSSIQKNPNAEVRAVFTLPEDKLVLDGIKVITDDWRHLIDDPEIDAVVIATPTTSHAEIACYAAQAKKHIFLEKPMGRTVEDCTKIITAANENGIKLFLAHVVRFWPSYSAASSAVANSNSDIGDVKMIRATRYSSLPGWGSWFLSEELSGGCILDLSIHDIDWASYMIKDNVKSVYCEGRKLPEKDVDNWMMSMTTLNFEKGQIAQCEASWCTMPSYGFVTRTEIIGTEGIIKFDSDKMIPNKWFGEEESSVADPYDKDGYNREMDAFISCVLKDTPPLVTGEDGKRAVQLCLAAIISAKEGRPVNPEELN